MKTFTIAAAIAVGAAGLALSAPPAPASAQAACPSYSRITTLTKKLAGRQITLWRCSNAPYFHGNLRNGVTNDLVWVLNFETDEYAAARVPAGRSSVNTAALMIGEGQGVRICARLVRSRRVICSKVFGHEQPPSTPPVTITS